MISNKFIKMAPTNDYCILTDSGKKEAFLIPNWNHSLGTVNSKPPGQYSCKLFQKHNHAQFCFRQTLIPYMNSNIQSIHFKFSMDYGSKEPLACIAWTHTLSFSISIEVIEFTNFLTKASKYWKANFHHEQCFALGCKIPADTNTPRSKVQQEDYVSNPLQVIF